MPGTLAVAIGANQRRAGEVEMSLCAVGQVVEINPWRRQWFSGAGVVRCGCHQIGVASDRNRRAGAQPIAGEVEEARALATKELARLLKTVNIQVKVFVRSPDIGLDVNAVPGWTRTPSVRQEHVL